MTPFDDNGVRNGPAPGGPPQNMKPPNFNVAQQTLELQFWHPEHGVLQLAFPVAQLQRWAAELTIAQQQMAEGAVPPGQPGPRPPAPSQIIIPHMRPPRDIKKLG